MPSDSIAGFLDRAQASRVLFPEQVEQLIRQPDAPQSDIAALSAYLLARGVVTQFQADAIRDGRGDDLSFAGYPLIDRLGPCPGGTAYRALHPSLRTPLVLRRLSPGAFAPSDTAEAVVQRARTFGAIRHPNIQSVVDAGVHRGDAYAVVEQTDGSADLGTLVAEVGGAMPGFLAAEYGWAIASALRAVHERGGWHGEVRPGLLVVAPVATRTKPDGTTRRRPAPNATLKLTETGLVPVTLPAAVRPPAPDVLAYLPPERLDGSAYEPSGDIYGLGASLYLLLTGRPPFAGETAEELIPKVRSADPPSLADLRPTEPPELTGFVMKMLSKRPADRPRTAAEVCQALAPFCRPGVLPAAASAGASPQAVPVSLAPQAVPAAEEAPEPDGWGVTANAFADAQAASSADSGPPRRRQLTKADKARSRLLLAVGLCLHLTAVGLLVAWAAGLFTSPPEPIPEPKEQKKPDTSPKPKQKKQKAVPERDPG
jgi:serine/threonine protein kinase